jgi:hypothetical protein
MLESKVRLLHGDVFIYNKEKNRFVPTKNAELIGYVLLDMAEELKNLKFKDKLKKI